MPDADVNNLRKMKGLGKSQLIQKSPVWWVLLSTPLRWLYLFIIRLRNACYEVGIKKPQHLPGPTISVGNIEVGGTGKTPTCIAIARYILEKGGRPAILSRGYRSGMAARQWCYVFNGQIHKDFTNIDPVLDEAHFQSSQLPSVPIIVGVKRFKAAKKFLKIYHEPITHWILDDGFQHRQIYRDLDIVLLRGDRPLGNGFLLPTGTLREPPKALERAGILLYDQSALKDGKREVHAKGIPSSSSFSKSIASITLSTDPRHFYRLGEPAVAVSAIARNEDFWRDLQTYGVNLVGVIAKADHFSFSNQELMSLVGEVEALIVTEKDFYRQRTLYNDLPKKVYLAKLEIKFIDKTIFELIDALTAK